MALIVGEGSNDDRLLPGACDGLEDPSFVDLIIIDHVLNDYLLGLSMERLLKFFIDQHF